MGRLVLHPTIESQWQALVIDARQHSAIQLSEELESYLVFLLMRFVKNPEILQSILALDFLNTVLQPSSSFSNNLSQSNFLASTKNKQNLRDIGDKCLLFSGLFPGLAKRRRVHVSYYVKLGQSAYSLLSTLSNNSFPGAQHPSQLATLFANLGEHFVGLMDVLHTIRSLNREYHSQEILELLNAYELLIDTKSQHAFTLIKNATMNKDFSILDLGSTHSDYDDQEPIKH